MPNIHQLQPGQPVDLTKMPTEGRIFQPDRQVAEDEFKILRDELIEMQQRFYAEGSRK